MTEPHDEEISGNMELVGRLTAKATIMCVSYVQFKKKITSHPLALELYSETVKITHEFPQFLPLGAVQYN